MISFINKNFRIVLIVILIAVGGSFVFFGAYTPAGNTPKTIGSIGGRSLSTNEYFTQETATRTLIALQYGFFPPSNSGLWGERIPRQTWERMILVNEAKKMDLWPSPSEVADYILELRLFQDQKTGKFDKTLYDRFNSRVLTPQGITPARFQEIVSEQIVVNEIHNSVFSLTSVRPEKVESELKHQYGKTTVLLAEFNNKDLAKSITPTGEDLQKYHDENIARYQSPERRKFQYVEFKLPADYSKLQPKEQKAAKRQAGEKAFAFAEHFLSDQTETSAPPPDFATTAASQGYTVQTSKNLAMSEPLEGNTLAAPTAAAFRLSLNQPISQEIEANEAFFVIKLLEITPPATIPFDQVKKQVKSDYTAQELEKVTREKGSELIAQVKSDLKNGKPIEKAFTSLKLKTTNLPPFVPGEAGKLEAPHAENIRFQVKNENLSQGDFSPFNLTKTGGFFYYISEQAEPDEDKANAQRPIIRENLLRVKKGKLYYDWFKAQIRAPGNTVPEEILSILQGGA